MKRLTKFLPVAAIAASLAALATPASAAETILITGSSGTFGNDQVVCGAGSTTCNFTNTFSFASPVGFNLANATISTSAAGLNNIDFTSVLLNGAAFTLTPTGMFEFGSVGNVGLRAGLNTLTVNGRNTGDGAFSGTLTFAAVSAVPEPATWAMMLIGFGAVGAQMRRRRSSLLQVA